MSSKLAVTLAVVVLAVAVVLFSQSRLPAQMAGAGAAAGANAADRTLTHVLTGSYRVNLDTGTGANRLDQITRIEFHDEYIMVSDFRGAGRIIPVSQVKQLSWDPT